jgi:hypothetical protein
LAAGAGVVSPGAGWAGSFLHAVALDESDSDSHSNPPIALRIRCFIA